MADELAMMYELRVLSGLHQGAALPLFGEQCCIGASPQADMELYDPGVEDRHALLLRTDDRWALQAQEGLLRDETGTVRAHIANLRPGVEFFIGDIRLCVADTRSAWMDDVPDVPTPSAGLQKMPSPARPRKKWLVATLSILLLALAGLIMLPSTRALAPAVQLPPASDRRLLASIHEVHQQLVRMLVERELGHLISLEVTGNQVTLQGEVGKEPLALVSRMLARFEASFETPVLIVNDVRQTSTHLPFKIVQIIGGPKAHVVLADGRRLFSGDEVDGLRLTAIDSQRLLFEGKQRYEVNW